MEGTWRSVLVKREVYLLASYEKPVVAYQLNVRDGSMDLCTTFPHMYVCAVGSFWTFDSCQDIFTITWALLETRHTKGHSSIFSVSSLENEIYLFPE